MQLTEKNVNKLIFATQGVGTAFVAVFLVAYLGGLPSTNILHSEPAFKIALMIFGAAFLALILATILASACFRKDKI